MGRLTVSLVLVAVAALAFAAGHGGF